MKLKTLVTIVLLVFVGASVGFLIYKESRNRTETRKQLLQSATDQNMRASKTVLNQKDQGDTRKKNAGTNQDSVNSVKQPSHEETKDHGQKTQTAQADKPYRKVVAYYFHGNTRCTTCRMIEAYARLAVYNGFPDEMKKGGIEFRLVNVEEFGNEHFVQDYQLVTRSLVLVRFSGEKQEKWENLDRVWDLVNDKEAFERYVQDETKKFLEES